jgi:type IV secretory pathway VirB2 component (pilin)
MTRGQLGRSVARVELAVAAISGFVLAPFLYLAAPASFEAGATSIQPMFVGPKGHETALAGIAIAGFLIGFAWMVRIYRANPEPDQRAWRYREQD